jgi:thiol-disulfide isomerase/thioredoxin
VVLIDFWTYTCINCLRTLPQLRAWDARYRDDGLTIVGVHTPEFTFERDLGNVERAVRRNRLRYAVAQDNSYETWNAWGNQYWPAKYLIDAQGRVRYTHFGEGAYDETETAIRALLAESGRDRLGDMTRARTEAPDPGVATPETYLGFARASGFVPARPRPGTNRYPPPPDELSRSRFALSGVWRVSDESAAAVGGAAIHARVVARKVFLVLSAHGPGRHEVRVDLDGEPLRRVAVRGQRLYRLVALPKVADQRLTLRVDPGVSAYAFTFG